MGSRRFDRLDPVFHSSNKTDLSHWKGKPIIPLDEWIKFRDTPYALDYFPNNFDRLLSYIPEDELKEQKREDVRKWDSDYRELMEYTKNSNYGRFKCFHCLMSPDGDDPIFIGINRLVAKGLNNVIQQGDGLQYPCQVVNRFQCPYARANIKEDDANSNINVDDFFRLHRMALLVEVALARARNEDSKIQIRDKQDLLRVLTNRDTFAKISQQADDSLNTTEYRDITAGQENNDIADYFMRLKNHLNLNELRFY